MASFDLTSARADGRMKQTKGESVQESIKVSGGSGISVGILLVALLLAEEAVF